MINDGCNLINKKIKLSNIDGLGEFKEGITGIIILQLSKNRCKIKLDKRLEYKGNTVEEINIITRHKGYDFTRLEPRGLSKLLNLSDIIAVNAFDDNGKIGFIAEIELI